MPLKASELTKDAVRCAVQVLGSVKIVAGSDRLLAPEPFPATRRSRQEWERFLYGLYIDWDNQWQAPAEPRAIEEKK